VTKCTTITTVQAHLLHYCLSVKSILFVLKTIRVMGKVWIYISLQLFIWNSFCYTKYLVDYRQVVLSMCTKMHIGLHVMCPLCCPLLTKTGMCWYILAELPCVRCHENPLFVLKLICEDKQIKKHGKANNHILQIFRSRHAKRINMKSSLKWFLILGATF
jgi:hypothetical protein